MLGEIVIQASFPAAELEQERQVLLQEFAEDHDDVEATAFKCFDRACYGEHPASQPVIGTRSNLRRFTRDDLVSHVARHYTGTNTVVAVIGDIDAEAIVRGAGDAFCAMPRGEAPRAIAPAWIGGHRARRMAGSSQAQVIVGFPIPPRPGAHEPYAVAAAVFGEGMSSPLLDELRERRGIVYHASCSAEVRDLCGQFVIEASTTPDYLRTYGTEVARLLHEHAATIDPVALDRARNQIGVRLACENESPPGRIERAALDLFAYGRILGLAERMDRIAQVGLDEVRDAFTRMLEARAAVAIAGAYGRGEESRLAEALPGAPRP